MKFTIKVGAPEKQRSPCVVLPVFDDRRLTPYGEKIDHELGGKLIKAIRQGDCEGKKGQIFLAAERYLLLGAGPAKQFTTLVFKEILSKLYLFLLESNFAEVTLPIEDFVLTHHTTEWKIRQAAQWLNEAAYRFDEFKSGKKAPPAKLSQCVFALSSKKSLSSAQRALDEAIAISAGMDVMKNLANLPPNICTPAYLADEAKRFAKKHAKTSVAILEKKDLEALKMGSLLSVSQGSIHPPKFITLSYRGGRKSDKPIVLVGKGITFDTGGNSIKPSTSMIGMKFDMSGAASIYGVFKAVEMLQLPIHLIGVIPACENMPGPYASRPDDVVTSMSGQTIEILNTDAEGRLILADALTYSERFHPAAVIDIATLTGACIIALGHHYTGLMGNNETLNRRLLEAAKQANDLTWEMPLGEEYTQALQSEVADLANIAGPDTGAGSIVAGCFLSKFTQKYPWAHLDIAGTACYFAGPKRGSSGRPVPLLVQYLINYTENNNDG